MAPLLVGLGAYRRWWPAYFFVVEALSFVWLREGCVPARRLIRGSRWSRHVLLADPPVRDHHRPVGCHGLAAAVEPAADRSGRDPGRGVAGCSPPPPPPGAQLRRRPARRLMLALLLQHSAPVYELGTTRTLLQGGSPRLSFLQRSTSPLQIDEQGVIGPLLHPAGGRRTARRVSSRGSTPGVRVAVALYASRRRVRVRSDPRMCRFGRGHSGVEVGARAWVRGGEAERSVDRGRRWPGRFAATHDAARPRRSPRTCRQCSMFVPADLPEPVARYLRVGRGPGARHPCGSRS